jgi:nucleotide-binding universal stress UspA family protein
MADAIAGLRWEADQTLRSAEVAVSGCGVPAMTTALFGPVIACIECEVQPGDVIVMATHGEGGANRKRFGSVAARLMRTARVPVIVLRGEPAPEMPVGAYFEDRHFEPIGVV